MKVLITGGTGSLGRALIRWMYGSRAFQRIVVLSRDEYKQHELVRDLPDARLKTYVGDVRDPKAVSMAIEGVDTVIVAHALKRIDQIEHNPVEALKTNTLGVQNVIEAAMHMPTVRRVLLISTDKAVEPINAYGFTKGMAERLIVSANFYRGPREIAFSAVRYGNVMDSRGSAFWTWVEAMNAGKRVQITNPNMTRFHMLLLNGVDLVFRALDWMEGAEIFVPTHLRSYDMKTFFGAFRYLFQDIEEGEIVGIRAGEKMHETLISIHEMPRTLAYSDHYEILPPHDLREKYGLHLDFHEDDNEVLDLLRSDKTERISMDDLAADMKDALKRGVM